MSYKYTFTVFTPTFNRAHTLHRVYESLQAQTFRDFEWLIVDDGSSDDTKMLVEKWQGESTFPIRYVYQENQGKHVAFNRGVQLAQGALFLTFDSDDSCVPEALERFKYHWDNIPNRKNYSAVTALCMTPRGQVVGSRFPSDIFDSDSQESYDKFRIAGEKWGFQKTDVLKMVPFPEFKNERFCPESLVWFRIARRGLKTRYINEPLRIYETRKDGYTFNYLKTIKSNPRAISLTIQEHIRSTKSKRIKLRQSVNYVRYSLHCKILPDLLTFWLVPAIPIGLGLYLRDILRNRKTHR